MSQDGDPDTAQNTSNSTDASTSSGDSGQADQTPAAQPQLGDAGSSGSAQASQSTDTSGAQQDSGGDSKTIKVWINAFIPGDVPGYTFNVPAGPHAGKTAIPCPLIATPVNPRCPSSRYLTDQRTFDPSPTASVRMRSIAEIQLQPPLFVRHPDLEHVTSGTTEINKTSGEVTCAKNADMSRCSFNNFRTEPDPSNLSNFTIKLEVVAAASDPCVNLAADIDYAGTFSVFCSPSGKFVQVTFDGKIDSFPAFEAYATINGSTKALFTVPPPAGNTVADLVGSASSPIGGVARFENLALV